MHTYPLLKQVFRVYKGVDLSNVLLLANQHLLADQEMAIRSLLKAGLRPENCVIAGKCYSTNRQVMNDLLSMGCVVAPFSLDFEPMQSFDEWFSSRLGSFILQDLLRRNLTTYRKIVALDDGGFLHLVVDRLCRGLPNLVGIEQTSSGHHRIKAARVGFPVGSVARNYIKLTHESPLIARNVIERVERHLRQRNRQDPNVLVFGLGPVGRQVAGQLFLKHKWRGCVFDPKADQLLAEERLVDLLTVRHRVLKDEELKRRLGEFDVIIGATGSPVLSADDIARLHPEVSLISVSSSDREFPALAFRCLGKGIHDDYWRDGRCLVNGGFPITFDGSAQAMPPQEIELTIALLMIYLMSEASDHRLFPIAYPINQIYLMWTDNKESRH